MKLIEIISELQYFIESHNEAGVALKKGFTHRFACRVKRMERDPDKKVGYYIELERSTNTTGFPTEAQVFKCGINEIKSIDDY